MLNLRSLCLAAMMSLGLLPLLSAAEAITWPSAPASGDKYEETVSDIDPTLWGAANVHDPAIFRDDDGTWYAYSTDANKGAPLLSGLQIRKSTNLIDWEWVGTAFKNLPREGRRHSRATIAWAPDVIKLGNKYLLYYCMSAFGTSRSYIGVAEAASPAGPFVHTGEIVKSVEGDEVNAIDPSLIRDKDGRLWMVYGSFFGGIHLIELDAATGLRKSGESGIGKVIAGGSHAAFEGPALFLHGDFYYLFLSCGDLMTDYSIRVARCPVKEGIDGVYRDYKGRDMSDAGFGNYRSFGNKLLGSFAFDGEKGIRAPGGQSVIADGDRVFLVHHTRTTFKPSWFFYLNVRQLYFNADGWPCAAPHEYADEKLQAIPPSALEGTWQVVKTVRKMSTGPVETFEGNTIADRNEADASPSPEKDVVLHADGTASGGWGKGTWSIANSYQLNLNLGKVEYKGFVTPAWDWMSGRPVLSFTAMGSDGEYIFGNFAR